MSYSLQAYGLQHTRLPCPSPSPGVCSNSYPLAWHPTPVLLPGKPHGWKSLVGCNPWSRQESDTTEVTYSSSSMSIELVMLSNHLILCYPLLLLPSIFPRIRVFFQWVSSSHHMAKVLELQLQCMALMYG